MKMLKDVKARNNGRIYKMALELKEVLWSTNGYIDNLFYSKSRNGLKYHLYNELELTRCIKFLEYAKRWGLNVPNMEVLFKEIEKVDGFYYVDESNDRYLLPPTWALCQALRNLNK